MELKKIINFFAPKFKWIFLSGIIFGAIGLAINYYLPKKYYATASLYIRRTIYPYSEEHFTYEGYYSQQAAMFYTNSVIGLIESDDIRSMALESLGVSVNEKNLRQYDKKIRTAKNGPQVVTLITKGETPNRASELWEAVANSTINTMSGINQRGDPFVSIVKVMEKPIVKESFREAWVYTAAGFFVGVFLSSTFFTLKSYFKIGKKK